MNRHNDSPEERARVSHKIAHLILEFARTWNSPEFSDTNLYNYCLAREPRLRPGSTSRILRDLRWHGVQDYDCINRTNGIYRFKDSKMQDFLKRFSARHGPVARTLSRLIRPALIASKGKTLVWGDLSSIEARVLPWLARSDGGEAQLDRFRASDADPSLPDVYQQTAGDLTGKDPLQVTKAERQTYGKVPVLSLGFGGSIGALLNMATNYNVYLSEEQAFTIVNAWRRANAWAPDFWDELWRAALAAKDNPHQIFHAGRVSFVFKPEYLKGSLLIILPDSRVLTYPAFRLETRQVKNKQTGKQETVTQYTYLKGHGRAGAWHGKFAENVTQAVAGSILRNALVILEHNESEWMPVVAHTHDDIVVEVDKKHAKKAAFVLREVMMQTEDWSEGLPLAVDVTCHGWFTKALD